ncbi:MULTISPECIES: DUF551 domain-containing protein [Lachnospiraceae]|uniref:DUF551 domain-containing protein n=1 Tax=Faecalicatena acetigenes TaxID=2981790 RepID=A0ABT2T7T5_9FIRM|nr:DUF551 domain-containing protein [Faecalicatena acetigenes]MCU6746329.1 DUF551 domain-containing protein [Faecalicatena acetigenes]SCH12819.1 Protein of uncharacterised function (DUF551) [uncultured Clostridium sp.]
MNVLEKILEEIEEEIRDSIPFSEQRADGLRKARDIIRKHMDDLSRENSQENARLPRDNDGWIPVEERLPEPSCDVLVQWEKYERYTDTIYTYMDKMWFDSMDENGNAIFETIGGTPNGKIIAWQPLPEPYRPEKEKSSCKERIMSRFMKVE